MSQNENPILTQYKTLTGNYGQLVSCKFSPNGTRILSQSNSSLTLWNIETGEESLLISDVEEKELSYSGFSPDGKYVIMAGLDFLDFLDIQTGKYLSKHFHWRSCIYCAISPDRSHVLFDDWDDDYIKIWSAVKGKVIAEFCVRDYHFTNFEFSPNGRWILGQDNHSNNVYCWNAQNGEELESFNHKFKDSFRTISPNGKFIASVGYNDQNLKILDAETRNELANIVIESELTVCSFSPCGTKLVSGDSQGKLYLFKLENLKKEPVAVTAMRLWQLSRTKSWFLGCYGKWNSHITFHCPICGINHNVSQSILEKIRKMNQNADDEFKDSVKYSGLLSECPKCDEKIRFNPFIIDKKSWASMMDKKINFLFPFLVVLAVGSLLIEISWTIAKKSGISLINVTLFDDYSILKVIFVLAIGLLNIWCLLQLVIILKYITNKIKQFGFRDFYYLFECCQEQNR